MAKPMKTPRKVLGAEAPLYRVTAKSYIDGVLCGPGTDNDTIRYNGIPGKHLVPMNEPAVAAKNKALGIEPAVDPAPKSKGDAKP